MSALDVPVIYGRHAPLQSPTKCRCNNLQNHFATTYINILQFSAKRGCKKHTVNMKDNSNKYVRKVKNYVNLC